MSGNAGTSGIPCPAARCLTAIVGSIVAGTIIVSVGIPNLPPVPFWETLLVFLLSALFAFVINDTVKAFFVEKAKLRW